MKYIKKFENHSTYGAAKSELELPNVSLCVLEDEVHYNPIPHDYSKDYFTIVSLMDNNEIYWNHGSSNNGNNLSYSLDGTTWTSLTTPSLGVSVLITTLNTGEKVMLKGTSNCFCDFDYYFDTINSNDTLYDEITDTATGSFNVEGNIMSLINGDNFLTDSEFPQDAPRYILGHMFRGSYVYNAENLILPATELTYGCYFGMFMDSWLEIPPKILPATISAEYCYDGMFLSTAITKSPSIPNVTHVGLAFANMFYNCTHLNYIKCLIENPNSLYDWVYNVSLTGTFVKHPDAQWSTGVNGIPSGWTIETASS